MLAAMGAAFGSSPDRMGFHRLVRASPAGRIVAMREAGAVIATGGALSLFYG